MGIMEIITLVITIAYKVVLPIIGGGAVAAATIPRRRRWLREAGLLADAVGFNFGNAKNAGK